MFRFCMIDKASGLTVFMILGLLACGCRQQVLEHDVAIGKQLDSGVGYYAYYSGIAEREPNQVALQLATEAEIGMTVEIGRDQAEVTRPIVGYLPSRIYVWPEQLIRGVPGQIENTPEGMASKGGDCDTLVMGYFMKRIGSEDEISEFLPQGEPAPLDGLYWADSSERFLGKFEQALVSIREYAGLQGADAVVEVSCFAVFERFYGGAGGVYVSGTAVAYGEVEFHGLTNSRSRTYEPPVGPAWQPSVPRSIQPLPARE